MFSRISITGLILGSTLLWAQPMAARPVVRPRIGPKMGVGRAPGGGAANPALERWRAMTPGERQRALEKLPPERREEMRRRWEQFEANERRLNPDQRDRLHQAFSQFRNLPPERQQMARKAFRQLMNQPEDRRVAMRNELESLRAIPAEERRARIDSEEFKGRFAKHERGILSDLSDALPE